MLTTRERKILELLYRNEKALTTAEIANSLHISTRTIKSDIPKIKEEYIHRQVKEYGFLMMKEERNFLIVYFCMRTIQNLVCRKFESIILLCRCWIVMDIFLWSLFQTPFMSAKVRL